MDEAAGFQFVKINAARDQLAPLVLLHGSGGCETTLMAFAHGIAPDRVAFALRGQIPWEGGYAFFRRNADRTLDHEDLSARAAQFCDVLRHLTGLGHRRPLLLGYSNGAIMAAAAVIKAPELSSGALLFRPLSPCAEASFPQLHGYPVLLVGGALDKRRHPSDTPHIAGQFEQAGCRVAAHILPGGHAWDEDGQDHRLARDWLAGRP
jgi:phospholipase/carboxylesterase